MAPCQELGYNFLWNITPSPDKGPYKSDNKNQISWDERKGRKISTEEIFRTIKKQLQMPDTRND